MHHVFLCFSEAAKDDPVVVQAAVRRSAGCLAAASAACREDREIVLEAVAPALDVWHTRLSIGSEPGSTVDIDDISMETE